MSILTKADLQDCATTLKSASEFSGHIPVGAYPQQGTAMEE